MGEPLQVTTGLWNFIFKNSKESSGTPFILIYYIPVLSIAIAVSDGNLQ